MRIALVTDQYDGLESGAAITANRLAEGLRADGHKVIIHATGKPAPDKVCAASVKIPIFQELISKQGMTFARADPALYYEAFHDADIAQFFMPFEFCAQGEKYARQMKVPCLAAFHTLPENITSSIYLEKCGFLNRFIYRWFYKKFYCHFDYIHCPSEFVAGKLREHHYDAQMRVISNGVSRAFVKMDVPRADDGLFRILMIGRYSREKRQDLLIEAVKRSKYNDRIQIVMAGKGPREKHLRSMAKGLAREPVMGFYSQEELVRLINACDLYVHGADAEIEGMSCLEAMACGLVPIISDSKLSAAGQFALHDMSLFRAGSPDDLRDKFEFWMEHPELRAEMSEKYALKQEENRVDICVAQMEKLYEDVIANSKRKEEYIGKIRRLFIPKKEKVNNLLVSKKRGPGIWVQAVSGAVATILRPLTGLALGLKIVGKENLRALRTGAITVSNHVHSLDGVMIRGVLPLHKMWVTSSYANFTTPGVGFLIRLLGAVSLGSNMHEQKKVSEALERHLQKGDFVHFFPEGMLVPYYEGLRKCYSGAFTMAAHTGCPVVPMVYAQRERRGLYRLLKRKPCLTLHVMPAIYPNTSMVRKVAAQDLQYRVERAMREKLGGATEDMPATGMSQ